MPLEANLVPSVDVCYDTNATSNFTTTPPVLQLYVFIGGSFGGCMEGPLPQRWLKAASVEVVHR
jgi:hypothetical protein